MWRSVYGLFYLRPVNLASHQEAEQELFLDAQEEKATGTGYVRVTDYFNAHNQTWMNGAGEVITREAYEISGMSALDSYRYVPNWAK
jgi:hypothetical protein